MGDEDATEGTWGVLCDGCHSPVSESIGIDVERRDEGADSVVAGLVNSAEILPTHA